MKQQRYFSGQDGISIFQILQKEIGYPLKGSLLSQAFRRSSFCSENGGKSNESLEFIGDQVLSFYTVKFLSQRLSGMNYEGDYACRIPPSRFSAIKQSLLSNENFSKIVDGWGIADYLIVGKDDEKNQVQKQTKIKADLLEAIVGAIAEDCKWDAAILEKVVSKILGLEEQVEMILATDVRSGLFDIDNAVTTLKELAEREQITRLSYDFCGPECLGKDANGDPIWGCTCRAVNDATGFSVLVYASSKKDAKKMAAYLVLCEHFQVPNQFGSYGFNDVMGKTWIYKNGELKPKE